MKTSLSATSVTPTTGLVSPTDSDPSPSQPRAAAVPKKSLDKPMCYPALGIPLLDPRVSSFLMVWDFVTLFALIFTALVTPFEISFLTDFSLALFLTNRTIDAIFSFDMFVTFVTMIPPSKDTLRSGFSGASSATSRTPGHRRREEECSRLRQAVS